MSSENTLFPLPDTLLRPMVEQALSEDLGRRGDITSTAVIAPDKTAKLFLVSREDGVIAGMDLARLAFQTMDPSVRFQAEIHDGQAVRAGQTLAAVEGNARALLAAERTALNYLTHLSGIATATARAVAEVAEYGTDIVCSRKTIPLLRVLQKYAVRAGGGVNHRMGLDDAVLIKDNHLAYCGSIAQAVRQAKQAVGPLTCVEIEVDTLAQLDEAIAAGAERILLDNMDDETLKQHLAKTQDTAALPRYWRFAAALPRNPQAKIREQDFQTAFTVPQTAPQWAVLHANEEAREYAFEGTVPLDLAWFGGHFADFPLVPGVIEVQWAMDLAARFDWGRQTVQHIENLKYQHFVRPHDTVQLTLRHDVAKNKIHFAIRQGDTPCASGRMALHD